MTSISVTSIPSAFGAMYCGCGSVCGQGYFWSFWADGHVIVKRM